MRRELNGRKERKESWCMIRDEEALERRCIGIGGVSCHLPGRVDRCMQ